MTAYALNASGNSNDSTKFTPNGVPGLGDTVSIGANLTMTIPVSTTFQATLTMGGSSQTARAGLQVYGTWKVPANATINSWVDIVFQAGSVLDGVGSFGLRMAVVSSLNVPFKITCLGTESSVVRWTRSDYVSGTPGALISDSTGAAASNGFLDATYLVIDKMASIQYGGGNNPGNHFRMVNQVFDDFGFFRTSANSNIADDWIFDKVDIRHTHSTDISQAYFMELLAGRNAAGTPTGIKRFRKVTLKFGTDDLPLKYLRFQTMDYFTNINYITDSVVVQTTSSNTAISYNGICARFMGGDNAQDSSRAGAIGGYASGDNVFSNNVVVYDATGYVLTGSSHWFGSKRLTTFEDNFLEELFDQTNIDGSEIYSPPDSGTASVKRNIVITQNGGALVNSYQADTSASITIEHNTAIAKYSNFSFTNPYGMLMRSEGKQFVGGTNVANSNLLWVIDTSGSSDGKIAAFNFSYAATPLADQIDTFDYNNYYNMSPTPPTGIYRSVISTTKTVGDNGYGMHDTFVTPAMTAYPAAANRSVILAFAATKSLSTTKDLWAELVKVNGFNETTRRQETSNIVSYGAPEIIAYAKVAVTPTSVALATGAHDGTSVGAVQYIIVDTTPDAFTFGTVSNANPSTVTTGPTTATIAGVTASTNISAVPSGGLEYRVSTDGGSTYGSWLSTTSNVQLGYKIQARVASSASYSTLVTGTLTVGGVAGTLQVTSRAQDATPDAFSFGSVSNANPSTLTVGTSQVTIAGVDADASLSAVASGGLEYRVSTNGGSTFGSWTTATTPVALGYVIEGRLTSSSSFSTLLTGTLTVGGVAGNLQVTTRAADTTPNAFTFGSSSAAEVSTVVVGPTQATIAGVDAGVNISAVPSGGLSYRISTNGGATFGGWQTGTTSVQLGYVIEARVTSSSSYSTLITGTLTVGGVPGTLDVVTRSQDATPDAFSFGSVVGANPNVAVTGPSQVTVAGVDYDADVTATPSGGLEFRVSSDGGATFGGWQTSPVTVHLGNVIEARLTSSTSFSTLITGTLALNGTSGTLQVTTRAADTTPNAFSFGALTNVDVATVTVSPTLINIVAVDAGVNILAVPSGGLSYRVSNDGGATFGSWQTGNTNVQLNAVIEARVTSSASYSTLVTGTLTVGGVAGTFQVTTKAGATAPDSFSFETVTGVTPGAIMASPTTVTVTGVTSGVDIAASASGGLEYRVSTDGGTTYAAWRTSGSNVRLGHKIQVRMQAPLTTGTEATGTFTMGGVSGTYTIKSWTSSGGGGGGGEDDTLSWQTLRWQTL